MKIFARVQFEAKVNPRRIKRIQNWLPALRQFLKRRLDQSRRPLRPWINVGPSQRARKCHVGLDSQIRRSFRRKQKLFGSPCLPRGRISSNGFRSEAVKCRVICRMYRHQLPLQVRRKLRKCNAACREGAQNLVAILAIFRRALQIEKPRVPRRNLHPFVAKPRRPFGNIA